MRLTRILCDVCEQECDQRRFGVLSGCVLKMNEKAEMGEMIFEGHYCENDVIKVIGFIEKLKNEQPRIPVGGTDQSDKG